MRPSSSNYTHTLAPFQMLTHSKSKSNGDRFGKLSNALTRQATDGYSNINKLTKIIDVKLFKTFTYLSVQV
jgi:hypothetical protein